MDNCSNPCPCPAHESPTYQGQVIVQLVLLSIAHILSSKSISEDTVTMGYRLVNPSKNSVSRKLLWFPRNCTDMTKRDGDRFYMSPKGFAENIKVPPAIFYWRPN